MVRIKIKASSIKEFNEKSHGVKLIGGKVEELKTSSRGWIDMEQNPIFEPCDIVEVLASSVIVECDGESIECIPINDDAKIYFDFIINE